MTQHMENLEDEKLKKNHSTEHSSGDLKSPLHQDVLKKRCEIWRSPLTTSNFIQFRGEQVLTQNWELSRQE